MRILLAAVLVAAAAGAQEASQRRVDLAAEADLHFELGTERFRARDYRSALEHFLASNRLVPNRNVVFDIAETYAQLKAYPDAYRAYIQSLEGETDEKERARIEKALARVAPSVAVLRVRTEPPGATLYIDRKDLGARGSSPSVLAFAPGTWRVLAELPGYEPASSPPIDAKAGSDTEVRLELKRILKAVRVQGQPSGAAVRADSGESCALPCELQLPLGKVTLTAQAPGFLKAKADLFVGDSNEPVDFDLTHETGRLVVNTDEHGAAVQIDGKLAGFTPAVIEVPVGLRQVRITAPGFTPVERAVEVARGDQPPLELQLTAVEEVSAASRTAESVDDAPGSVSIVTGKELRAMGYPTIAEALRGVRGIFVNSDTTYDSIGFRGYGPAGSYGNKVLVLLDGHATNDDWIGSSYVGHDNRADLDDLERIEIVRGPGSVLYGTGAFIGVVNLVTRPRDAPDSASATLGSSEGGALRGRAILRRSTDASGFDVSASGFSGSGQDSFYPALGLESRGADGQQAGTFLGKLWSGAFTLQAQATARDKTIPSGEYSTLPGDPRTHLVDRRSFAEARFEPKLSAAADLFLRASWDRYAYDSWLQSPPDAAGGLRRERFVGDWGGGEARLTLHPSAVLRLMAGGEWLKHFHVSQRGTSGAGGPAPTTYLNSDNPFDTSAGYLVAEVKPGDRAHLSLGARLDHYSTFGNSVNPRVTLIVKPTALDVIKLMAGRAFRAPSIYELYYNDGGVTQVPACPGSVTGCTALRPERVWSEEAELTHHFGALWTAVGSAFISQIADLTELRQAKGQPAGVFKYQNSSSPIHALGAEAELRREWRQGFMAALTYTFARLRYDAASGLRNVPNSPQHLASLKLAAPIVQKALMAMTRVSLEGPRWDRDASPGDPPQQKTSAGVLWDLVFSGEVQDWHLRYAFGIYNLADWKYEVPVSPEFGPILRMPQRGRSLLSSLTLGL